MAIEKKNMSTSKEKNTLWQKQNDALRSPNEIMGGAFDSVGINKKALSYKADKSFTQILKKLNITLFVTREYENLAIALNASNGILNQSFIHLPHPSGIVTNKKENTLYIAATRNPNQIIEFKVKSSSIKRKNISIRDEKVMMPARTKFYAGAYYFHDLAIIKNQLYANSVGQNGIIKINLNSNKSEDLIWWPKCVESKGKPSTDSNYIQLNSIAPGSSINNSFFSASGEKILSTKPGDINYPVDKTGVIFSGKTREVFGRGLTRPHSARIINKKLWVCNSGYGEIGFIENGKFIPQLQLPGWTRGLCFVKNILFVSTSMVLPRFSHYAPGLKKRKQICSIQAIDINTMKIIGAVEFPFGNQIFGIDYLNKNTCSGFPYSDIDNNLEKIYNNFLSYKV